MCGWIYENGVWQRAGVGNTQMSSAYIRHMKSCGQMRVLGKKEQTEKSRGVRHHSVSGGGGGASRGD